MPTPLATPADVLTFWREAGPDRWWKKDTAFDDTIRARFLSTWEAARDGKLSAWQNSDDGALALVIVLDQFPRNMFRNDPKMFSTDAKAVDVVARAVAEGRDDRTPKDLLAFLYMPYMHTETREGQARCVELFTKLGDPFNLKFAKEHADIIARFGRFPHRNATLGRTSTPEEMAFLEAGGFAG